MRLINIVIENQIIIAMGRIYMDIKGSNGDPQMGVVRPMPIADTCFKEGLKKSLINIHVLRVDAKPVNLTDQLKFFWELEVLAKQ